MRTFKHKRDLLIIHQHDLTVDINHFFLITDLLLFKINVMQLMANKT